jgi:hypothetical protein
MPYSTVRPIERFMQKVDIDPAAGRDACWLWAGLLISGTQPGFHPRGDKGAGPAPARRWAFQYFHRVTLAPTDKVSATCGDSLCVSPLHAFVRKAGLPTGSRDASSSDLVPSKLASSSCVVEPSAPPVSFHPLPDTDNGEIGCKKIYPERIGPHPIRIGSYP